MALCLLFEHFVVEFGDVCRVCLLQKLGWKEPPPKTLQWSSSVK
uniref:Uncharacterized protein n=1 Tax=Physcomitrium patens TaxID=3218 RepID=A0A2K1IGA9_PHYPA|nr:hypothetical protein PHYPA_028903 [Physcomitrium patens]